MQVINESPSRKDTINSPPFPTQTVNYKALFMQMPFCNQSQEKHKRSIYKYCFHDDSKKCDKFGHENDNRNTQEDCHIYPEKKLEDIRPNSVNAKQNMIDSTR